MTEDHFARAVEQGAPKGGQKEGQQPAVLPRRGAQPELAAHEKTPVLQGFAAGCEVVQSGRVEDRGLEPSVSSCRNTGISETRAAKCAAVGVENGLIDSDLVRVIQAWPTLPADIRLAILANIEAAQGR